MASNTDEEANRLSGRLARYARVGTGVGGLAARMAGARLFGREIGDARNAADLAAALGGLKGPLMKIAQLFSTIPDLLPPEYVAELSKLQANAPPMGPAFVKRRMSAELGPQWAERFRSFDRTPSAAASLGQVHRAIAKDGAALACKLQYPDMASAVEADLRQLGIVLALQRRFSPEIDTTEIAKELGDRVREELDYAREQRHMALYSHILSEERLVRVPGVRPELSTARLLTMGWLDGRPLLEFTSHSLEERNLLARALFYAWWRPFVSCGVIHGDPHLGNYTVFEEGGRPAGVNLFDYGSIRIFSPRFVEGVLELYEGLKTDDHVRISDAYRRWGFRDLSDEKVETLSIWARFIYAPLLDNRVRTIADGVSPQAYGRREVWEVKQRLKSTGGLTIPREFVLMDRAAIGLGSVFLHLRAELNFHALFEAELAGFSVDTLAERQSEALELAGLQRPEQPG